MAMDSWTQQCLLLADIILRNANPGLVGHGSRRVRKVIGDCCGTQPVTWNSFQADRDDYFRGEGCSGERGGGREWEEEEKEEEEC